MATFLLVLIAAISYFLGGFNGAIISSKYIFKKDIREYGSGNAGLTNFYRTFGVAGISLVVLVDAVKSIIAVILGSLLMSIVDQPVVGKIFAGFCLMLGHAYPAMYGLRGGKGVLCTGVLVLMVDWRVGLLCWLIFAVVVFFTRYVSLGAIVGCFAFPLGIWILQYGWLPGLIALFICLVLVFMHRENIMRLLAGKESRLELSRSALKWQ